MGVNMAGNCIIDDDVCREASLNEIVRRYFKCLCDQKASGVVKPERFKLELLMNQAGIALGEREVEKRAHAMSEATAGQPAAAIELADGTIVTGKTGPLLGAASSALLNALKSWPASIRRPIWFPPAPSNRSRRSRRTTSAARTRACTPTRF